MGTPLYDQTQQQQQQQPQNPAPQQQGFSQADIQAIVDERLAAQKQEHDAEVARLSAEVQSMRDAARGPGGDVIPNNGAGIGVNFEPTWSQHDQDLANRGEHPLQQEEASRE
jgi:hypothetical protein